LALAGRYRNSIMWIKSIGTGVSTTLFLYSLLSAVWGPGGSVATESLQKYQVELSQNISLLEDTNIRLQGKLDRMSGDHEVLRVHAHESGMLSNNEDRVRLENMSINENQASPGSILRRPVRSEHELGLIRFLSILLGFTTGLVVFFGSQPDAMQIPWKKSRSRHNHQGIRVQTASLE